MKEPSTSVPRGKLLLDGVADDVVRILTVGEIKELMAAAEEAAHDESASAMWAARESAPQCAQGMYEAAKCYQKRTGSLDRIVAQAREEQREQDAKLVAWGDIHKAVLHPDVANVALDDVEGMTRALAYSAIRAAAIKGASK